MSTHGVKSNVDGHPDISGTIERVAHVTSVVSRALKRRQVPHTTEYLYAYTLNWLRGTQILEKPYECVLHGLLPAAEEFVETAIVSASSQLSYETSIPPAALRTSSGWLAVLAQDGIYIDDMRDLDAQRGTTKALSVKHLHDLVNLKNKLKDRAYCQHLEKIYDNFATSERTFDVTIASPLCKGPLADIGWEMVRLESAKHVNLVWHQVNKLARNYGEIEPGDLLTWGWLGLRAALRQYNPSLGFAFSTYACTRIVGAMRDGIRAESPVPKRLGAMARIANSVEHDLTQSLGRTPTLREISEKSNISTKHLEIIQRTRPAASLDVGNTEDGGTALSNLKSTEDVEQAVLESLEKDYLNSLVDMLPAEEAQAIRLLVLEDLDTSEACARLGVTPRQIRQKRDKGLEKLRSSIAP